MSHQLSQEMRACADMCLDCYAACVETTSHCIAMGGGHAEPRHVSSLADCASLCEASANFMLRSSEMHTDVCGLCADACDACADSCERIGDADETMQRCIDACRRCAESCRQMAGMA